MESFIQQKESISHTEFTKIANKLMNQTKLISGQNSYRICEIEFYLNSKTHADQYTHDNPDQATYGKWYFHKTSKGNYRGGTFKGLDLTLGDKEKYCGILIRSIYDLNAKKMIGGPCNSVNELIAQHGASNVKEFMAKDNKQSPLSAIENDCIKIRDCDFEKGEGGTEEQKEALYYGPRYGLSDKYPVWEKAKYRYVIKLRLVKKQKRSLVPIESHSD